jgi:hypothetical protein
MFFPRFFFFHVIFACSLCMLLFSSMRSDLSFSFSVGQRERGRLPMQKLQVLLSLALLA